MLTYDELQKEVKHYREVIDSTAKELWILTNRPGIDPGVMMAAMQLGASLYNKYQDKRVVDELNHVTNVAYSVPYQTIKDFMWAADKLRQEYQGSRLTYASSPALDVFAEATVALQKSLNLYVGE